MSAIVARRQAEHLLQRFHIKTPSICVDKIADELRLKVVRKSLRNVSGLLVLGDAGRATICVNVDHEPYRQRLAVAHEIGHYHLQHQLKPGKKFFIDEGYFISQRGARAVDGVDPIEIEATQFALALLMPTVLLRASVVALQCALLLDFHVAGLAGMFEVPEQAMTVRLSTLGYL